ncbi:hypothetical protein F511_44654 [Dorcoceras hygrometricum]|uniref:Retrotransposon gag domain-containing protein n=1 Tax=Dorcoceras hygrometricum TaxID=472368 RepID=A0A2Z6ZYT3_9LAMI|nr:hypothetical protein F511_44654 [Dorcoceras hygrometricum]
MSGRGRGRRSTPVEETNPDSNARIAQLLELLVEQSGRGNGQSSSSRGPHFDYFQERPRCAIYMLRDDAMIWWEGAKLSVELANLSWDEFKRVFFEQYFTADKSSELKREFLTLKQGILTVQVHPEV